MYVPRHDANVLTAVLKTTANLLQKFPAIVYQMLHMEEPNSVTQGGDGCISMLVWPQLICGRSTYDKTQWVKEQLANVRNSCESVLLKGKKVVSNGITLDDHVDVVRIVCVALARCLNTI